MLGSERRLEDRRGRSSETDLLLPAGARLVHIGPYKTGTTTVQFAFHARRREIAAQGVHYAGRNSTPAYAVYGAIGRAPVHAGPPQRRRWRRLVRSVGRAGTDRVVISSEAFSDADVDAVARIASDLDPARIHVVVTLRGLASILASQWQQFVRGGLGLDYEPWLDAVLRQPESSHAQLFWHRHRHDRLIARWAGVVGAERVTAIVVDERDHEAVLRVFERLVGLREGTLTAQSHRTNRSMTDPEIEIVRTMNGVASDAGLDARQRHRLRTGAVGLMIRRSPRPDEPRIVTPAWAIERVSAVGEEIVAGIAASGVRVVGDLRSLVGGASSESTSGVGGTAAWPELSVAAGMGVVFTSGLVRNGRLRESDLAPISTPQLRRAVSRRLRQAVATRAPWLVAVVRRLRRLRPRRS